MRPDARSISAAGILGYFNPFLLHISTTLTNSGCAVASTQPTTQYMQEAKATLLRIDRTWHGHIGTVAYRYNIICEKRA